jgi:hypothetical protein
MVTEYAITGFRGHHGTGSLVRGFTSVKDAEEYLRDHERTLDGFNYEIVRIVKTVQVIPRPPKLVFKSV